MRYIFMRKKWSMFWNRSRQPRKQRKYRINAPLHKRQKLVSANLDKKLRERYKKRSLPLRTGDEVLVMRGRFKGKMGNVSKISLKKLRVYIDGLKIKKATGQEVEVSFDPSNLKIMKLNLDDKKRLKRVKR